ncbi:MAG: radical SAM protein [Candidatus Omnitrophica bacterium]|nr:radical SAM protein [Candidatus Omnitrophota bacterium]
MQGVRERLIDISQQYRAARGSGFTLRELIFFVTYACPFRCRTCFYARTLDEHAAGQTEELNLEEIRKISASLGTVHTLYISGGEPFLRDDLPEICEIFYRQNNIGTLSLPTSGFHTEKIYDDVQQIVRACPGARLIVGVALDGLRETHDALKGVDGSFDRAVETTRRLALLKERHPALFINVITTVSNVNINEVVSLAEFIRGNLPVDGHGPSPMRGVPYDDSLLAPSPEEWARVAHNLIGYHRYWYAKKTSNRLKVFLATNRTRYLYRLYTDILAGKKTPFRCQAGRAIGVLEPNGDVRLCESTVPVGNIRNADYDFKTIWRSGSANQMRERIHSCACTHACFLHPSIDLNPASLIHSYLYF